MPDEDHSNIGEVTKFLVGILQCRQVFLANMRVQIARFDARELGQIIDHLLLRGNVIVDKWDTFFGSLSRFVFTAD